MKKPVPAIPPAKQSVAINEDLCISFSTTLPKNAADIPKKKIAKLIAEGIHGGAIAEAPVANTSGTLYRVQVGAYSVKANAEAMLKKLKEAGFEGFIASSK